MSENAEDKNLIGPLRVRPDTMRALEEEAHRQYLATGKRPARADIIEQWRIAAGGIRIASPPAPRYSMREREFHDMLDRILGQGKSDLAKAVEVVLRNADAILGGLKSGEARGAVVRPAPRRVPR